MDKTYLKLAYKLHLFIYPALGGTLGFLIARLPVINTEFGLKLIFGGAIAGALFAVGLILKEMIK
jgi:hypothetical protein